MKSAADLSGSARVSRAGDDVPVVANFFSEATFALKCDCKEKFVAVRHRDQHARRMRYPDRQLLFFSITNA